MCPETQQRTAGQVEHPCLGAAGRLEMLMEAPPRGHICSLLTESKPAHGGSPRTPNTSLWEGCLQLGSGWGRGREAWEQ